MIYAPAQDETAKLIQDEIRLLREIFGSGEAMQILRQIGKPAIHFVLRTLERPTIDSDPFKQTAMINRCHILLKCFVQDGVMSMSELQRYRQILTSEKKDAS